MRMILRAIPDHRMQHHAKMLADSGFKVERSGDQYFVRMDTADEILTLPWLFDCPIMIGRDNRQEPYITIHSDMEEQGL